MFAKLSSIGLLSLFLLAGCENGKSSLGGKKPDPAEIDPTQGRELRPPRSGIKVGSLYYARETPTANSGTPVDLQDLCVFQLDAAQTEGLSRKSFGDLDLLRQFEIQGALEGVKLKAVTAGLEADLSRYYSYKLSNAYELAMPLVEAENLFESQAFRSKCSGWRKNIEKHGWAAYQVVSIKVGDLVFERRHDIGGDAELSAKVAKFEPKLRKDLKSKLHASYQGKAMVVSFHSLTRN